MLSVYSGLFMRFAWMVQPRNYLLLAVHAVNEGAQLNLLQKKLRHECVVAALLGRVCCKFHLPPAGGAPHHPDRIPAPPCLLSQLGEEAGGCTACSGEACVTGCGKLKRS